ncbi:MAG TPA: hypothetical protein VFV38_18500 [Ktedonobacteraceae bacterium]|nr:hypothetical protein [Ktedonobacteraceae bacterium]
MNASEVNISNEEKRQRVAAEVLELGQSLFETALEAGNHHSAEKQEGEVYPTEEIRAATEEFFTALQLLLRIEE